MKYTPIALFFLINACAKHPEPCASAEKSICTHNIVNGFYICKSPETGRDSIFGHWGWTFVDTVSVCDTAQWLMNKRKEDKESYYLTDPADRWKRDAFPNSCRCE
jgi:hypothetical protein